jgi:hypothetical protein
VDDRADAARNLGVDAVKFRKAADGWGEVVNDDGKVVFRYQLPPGPISKVEMVAFTDHILKLVKEREHGPS